MTDLENLEEIKKLDPKNIYGSTEMFADQCEQIWQSQISAQPEYKNINNIILCGMGGSAYGGYIAQSLYKDNLKVPIYINNDYHLPKYANENTLIIISSYSGNTEESLSCLNEAINRKCKIIGLTTGGKLSDILTQNKFPFILIDPKFNPSGQPRLGMGYMVLGIIRILNILELLDFKNDELLNAVKELRNSRDTIKKKAIYMAKFLKSYSPLIFSAEFLNGNAHILRNQFNETSKMFSTFSVIPELNHHLMEGLKFPEVKMMKVLFLTSSLFQDRIKKRISLTKEVIKSNKIELEEYEPLGQTPLSQVLNVLSFGGYVTLYLALLYDQDPSLIPWVDYFKQELSK